MHADSFSDWTHDHSFGQDAVREGERRTWWVILLTGAMMVVEIAAGLAYGSMALLADGLHMASHAGALGVAAMGANCGNNLADTEAAVIQMVAVAGDIPVISKANAGIPQWQGAELVYSGSPDVMAAHAHRTHHHHGATIIGGCCGNDPSHLAAIRGVLDGTLPVPEVDFTPAERAATSTRRRSRRRG